MKSLLYPSTLLLTLTLPAIGRELDYAPDPMEWPAIPAPPTRFGDADNRHYADDADDDTGPQVDANDADHRNRREDAAGLHDRDEIDDPEDTFDTRGTGNTRNTRNPRDSRGDHNPRDRDQADDIDDAQDADHTLASTATNAKRNDTLPAAVTCGIADFRDQMMERVNQARAVTRMCGRVMYPAAAPVRWNAHLFDAAANHSVDMSSYDYFAHTGVDGSSVADRLADVGYAWNTYAESIAAGQTSIGQVMEDLLKSPKHCAIVMKRTVTEMGGACASDAASTYKMYWSMTFGQPAPLMTGKN